MKLVVLAGAKKGAAVPIKKNSFIIGRSKEASLRAGSEAISRKHCVLKQTESGTTVQDLGSRNGTYVNDEKIDGVRKLENGDRLKVGPLEFRFESEAQVKQAKAPKIKNVGEAVARVASKTNVSPDSLGEDDISEWLLGDPGSSEMPGIGETLHMRNDETRIGSASDDEADRETQVLDALKPDAEGAEAEEAPKKKEPGKLPFRPEEKKAKDSREAAANILRDMARRR